MKKIFAIILSVMLIMSMGIVAYADPDTTTYTDATSITVTKSYKLVGAGSSPAETFTLEQDGNGVVKSGDATSAPALGTITGAAFAAGAATAEGATANITINLPEYNAVGIYEYILKEVAGTTAGVAYYGNNIKLVVTVINDDATGKLRVAAVHTEDTTVEGALKSDEFENTYSAGTLNITKTVEGALGDKDKYFEFTVTLTGEDGKTYPDVFAVSGGSNEDNPENVTFGDSTIYLKDGETFSIANLPYGVEYTVVEKDYSAEEYETTMTGDEGTINGAAQTAAFTNTKGGIIDTGVLLDSLPYVIIVALVAAAGIFMVIRRRKTEA